MSAGYEVEDAPDSNIQGSVQPNGNKKTKKSTCFKIVKGSFLTCLIAPPFLFFIVFSTVTVIFGGICYVTLVRNQSDSCEESCGQNTPDNWSLKTNCKIWDHNETLTSYIKENLQIDKKYVEEVEIKPSQKDLEKFGNILYNWNEESTISAYHYRAHNETAKQKTIIVTHDFRGCKRSFTSLMVSAMLQKNGYDVLSLTMRNHGKSESNGGFVTFGSQENFDVSAAFTYLNKTLDNVGFYGVGMGAASTIISLNLKAQSEGKTALFLDSMSCDMENTMKMYLKERYGEKISPEYLFWQMCQSSPVFSRFSCIPFQFDTLKTSMDLKQNENTTAHAFHFEHNKNNAVYNYENTEKCIKNIEENKILEVSQKITDYNVEGENEWKPFKNQNGCNTQGTNMLQDMKNYERRLISFFDNKLL
mmetsp:Transcript_13365/g.20169  ORF Transcript_13365/g.20169 Transcript_13365/m.20169 type:complete len:418 (+) Transcript_13365:44-1297(+)